MAKLSQINRNKKREKMVARYAAKRAELKAHAENMSVPPEERFAARMKLAKQALRWTDCSLDDLAFQLGYSEQTSFGRAFKRATGVTPNGFRNREKTKP